VDLSGLIPTVDILDAVVVLFEDRLPDRERIAAALRRRIIIRGKPLEDSVSEGTILVSSSAPDCCNPSNAPALSDMIFEQMLGKRYRRESVLVTPATLTGGCKAVVFQHWSVAKAPPGLRVCIANFGWTGRFSSSELLSLLQQRGFAALPENEQLFYIDDFKGSPREAGREALDLLDPVKNHVTLCDVFEVSVGDAGRSLVYIAYSSLH
jgi:hypothetical protein